MIAQPALPISSYSSFEWDSFVLADSFGDFSFSAPSLKQE